jgi:hypothetical protein
MKTNELTGAALEWAVAKCEGLAVSDRATKWRAENCPHLYATDWAIGGPIIDRENMAISHSPYDHVFYGRSRPWCAEKKGRIEYGSTPLIAAMRCYVASKLGDEIDIPKELT